MVALDKAERFCSATKPEPIKGCAALLAFLRRHLSDHPMMPTSIRHTVPLLGHFQITLEANLRTDDISQAKAK